MFNLVVFSLVSSAFAANWAVLVAGSNGFSNYRHQSDIFRCYKILIKNGFNPENIITMAYDDIANSASNPFRGQVFNVPDGPDVYIGSEKIDYKGKDVTAAKFYAVLTGNTATAGGKVLRSTRNDNVFIFYNDHGSNGLIAFPSGPSAYADELNKVFKSMYEKGMYKNLLVYIEACYSGSMFQNYLPTNMSVYAVTAANAKESSYATYCGIAKYKTCLSNEYSQAWMQHSDNNVLSQITVGEQTDHTRDATKMSHVMEFGQQNIREKKVSEFQSGSNIPAELFIPGLIGPPTRGENKQWKTVSQTEAHLMYLKTASEQDQFGPAAIEYHNELAKKKKEEKRRDAIAALFGMSYPDPNYVSTATTIDMDLYRSSINAYETICEKLNEYTFWSNTLILSRAVADGKLTKANFSLYEALLRRLA